MHRFLCSLLLAGCLMISAGCVQLTKEMQVANRSVIRGVTEDRTMTESYTEHLHRLNAVVDLDARALVDDIDLFWQRDRETRLTRWATP
ncbi:MAG: hypothetical protein ACE5GE_16365 [Phycisphaerae bacterium]